MTAKKDDDAVSSVEAAQSAAQAAVDEEHEKGYAGITVDPTPRENYTVQGVLAGKPTPEKTELETPGR
jgi:hypothetical protein